MKRYGIIILALVVAGLCSSAPAQEPSSFVVIVHSDNPADSVPKKKVSRLLLKELSKWEGGVSAEPVDLDSNSPVRQEFSRNVHGRSVSSIKNYWQRQIFSGRAVPPPEVPSDNAVMAHVRSHPGGIGYISSETRLGAGVKQITLE